MMGRDRKSEQRVEQFTKMIRNTMDTPAWRAITSTAQALYPWVKMEWKGPQNNNNGSISLAVRDAADRLGCSKDAAARGFHDLQAKGFLILTEHGRMGVEGRGAPPTYEITELPPRGSDHSGAKRLYLHWQEGHDYAVRGHNPVNPTGRNGRLTGDSKNKTLSSKSGRNVIKMRTKT